MLSIPGLHMLDDYARRLRSFQAYAVNAPVPTPQALHHPNVLQPLRLGQLQNKPIDFLLLHQIVQGIYPVLQTPVDFREF
jgi:hypothetical protein